MKKNKNFIKKFKEEENGITLIVLAITICVMAILIGITVNYTIGKNGILSQSEQVKANIEAAKDEGQQIIDKIKSNDDGSIIDGAVSKEDTEAPISDGVEITNVTESSFTVNLNVTETNSGIKSVKYSIDNGTTWNDEERRYSYTFRNVSPWQTAYNVQVKTIDEAGNENTYTDSLPGVRIPDGFVWVGGTKDSGLVISDAIADKEKYKGQTTVGTDLQGNQFVWIPVDSIADYKRTAYSIQFASGTTDTATNSEQIKYSSLSSNYFKEALPADEKTSVENNKGFYIGRYEAGDQESTDSKKLRASGAPTSNTITVKAEQAPYNNIKYTDAKKLAEGFSTKQKYTSVKSKLVSSYAWDTAIAFIQKTNSDYGSRSEEGNYKDSPTFTYTGIADTEKNKQTKVKGEGTLIPTGQTTAVNNIYDMGGNVWEWTTESYSDTNRPYTYRGGYCTVGFATYPAGSRNNLSDGAGAGGGFRLTLYL